MPPTDVQCGPRSHRQEWGLLPGTSVFPKRWCREKSAQLVLHTHLGATALCPTPTPRAPTPLAFVLLGELHCFWWHSLFPDSHYSTLATGSFDYDHKFSYDPCYRSSVSLRKIKFWNTPANFWKGLASQLRNQPKPRANRGSHTDPLSPHKLGSVGLRGRSEKEAPHGWAWSLWPLGCQLGSWPVAGNPIGASPTVRVCRGWGRAIEDPRPWWHSSFLEQSADTEVCVTWTKCWVSWWPQGVSTPQVTVRRHESTLSGYTLCKQVRFSVGPILQWWRGRGTGMDTVRWGFQCAPDPGGMLMA